MMTERIFPNEGLSPARKNKFSETSLPYTEGSTHEINKRKMFQNFTQRVLVLGALGDLDQLSKDPTEWLKNNSCANVAFLSKELGFDLRKPKPQITPEEYTKATNFVINGAWKVLDEALAPKINITQKDRQTIFKFLELQRIAGNNKIPYFYPEKSMTPNSYAFAILLVDHFSAKDTSIPEEAKENKEYTDMEIKSFLTKDKKHAKLPIELRAKRLGISVGDLEKLRSAYKVNPFGDLVDIDGQPQDF